MNLLQNPFYILNATQRDNRHRIMELAEKQSLLSDADKCMEARAALINPRKRVSAEVAWLPGVEPERVYDILLLLESSIGNRLGCDVITSIAPVDSFATVLVRVPYAKKSTIADEVLETLKLSKGDFREVGEFLGIHTLTSIARANLLAARMLRLPDYTSDVVAEWVLAIVQTFENINPSEVQAILNVEREASGFPEITSLSDITAEIQNCRRYYQRVIKFALDNIHSAKERVKTAMIVIESATDSDANHWSILVKGTVDAYEEGAKVILETEEKNIEIQEKKIRIAADEETSDAVLALMVNELLQTLKNWDIIAQPIQLNRNRQGLCHDASHDLADRVRLLAIFLFNEYDKLYFSLQILNALKEVFTEVSEINDRITADLEILNKIADQREQKKNEQLFFDNS